MDDSQSSDVFPNSGDNMDIVSYEYLVNNTKQLLSKNIQNEVRKPFFSSHFTSLLNDCSTCVTQSLELVTDMLSERNSNINQLLQYLGDAVDILRKLSTFITSVLESVSMVCHTMKTFPSATGRIIMAVFSHCKDSESLYGNQLKSVEKQLKDLFRTCHELQLTYLMVLEKHFIFNIEASDELDVLIEALDINLKIGKIVQTLDVKTMAEQWKGYLLICEKYSDALMDRNLHQNCTKVLCAITENNIKTAMEANEDDKIVLRSLKVASFTLKILFKVCNIFRAATDKKHDHIVDLLLLIYRLNATYLEAISGKSAQFINLMNVNVTNLTDTVLKELLLDEKFIFYISSIEISKFDTENQLGFILMIVSAIAQGIDGKHIKTQLAECVFTWLPHGHIWLNMTLRYPTRNNEKYTYGLYEHLLTHMFALASTFDTEEMNFLEQRMLQCLLSTDCYSALFSSNLWELLTSIIPRSVLLNQIMFLFETYETLSKHKQFKLSPQEVHLRFTISKLYNVMDLCDKTAVYKTKIKDDRNLLNVIEVKNLPTDVREMVESAVSKELKDMICRVSKNGIEKPEEIDNLINLLRICATCSFRGEKLNTVKDCVVKAWMSVCPNTKPCFLRGSLNMDLMWCLDFIGALVALTSATETVLQKESSLKKIIHIISGMIEKGCTELKLVLIDVVFIIALKYNFSDIPLSSIFVKLFRDDDEMVKNKLLRIKKYASCKSVNTIISDVSEMDVGFCESWLSITMADMSVNNLLSNLEATRDLEFSHKCLESVTCIEIHDTDSVLSLEKTCSGTSKNFDFADIDTLFESESDSEPACKKAKIEQIDTNDVENIIRRLEKDAALLYDVKENVIVDNFKDRIVSVCEKLKNILD